jgi:hypothetical protein
MKRQKAALVLALLLASSCVADRVVRSDLTPRYSRVDFSAAADGRDMRTVIYGNPFGSPRFDQQVTDAMTNTYVGPRVRFTTRPGRSAKLDYFVVLAFNPAPDVVPGSLCDGRRVHTEPAQRPLVVRAAFCASGSDATAATGYLDAPQNADDASFRSLITQLTLTLFP